MFFNRFALDGEVGKEGTGGCCGAIFSGVGLQQSGLKRGHGVQRATPQNIPFRAIDTEKQKRDRGGDEGKRCTIAPAKRE